MEITGAGMIVDGNLDVVFLGRLFLPLYPIS
jgi:hypothetical protein